MFKMNIVLARKKCNTMTPECLPICSELTPAELKRGDQCIEGRNLDTLFVSDVTEGVCKHCAKKHSRKLIFNNVFLYIYSSVYREPDEKRLII